VVGGLLVAVAAVGTFAAVTGAGQGPTTRRVVAARDIAPGSLVTEADLELVAVDVPSRLAGRTFTDPAQVAGAVAVGPVSEGELLQAGALAEGDDALVPTFSISVPRAAANGGDLQRGDRVQVFANYGSDTAATLQLLAPNAEVIAIEAGDDAVGSSGQVQLVLAITSPEERSKVLNATVSGEIALVRITGAADPEAFPTYRPDLDADTAESGTAEEGAGG
jgi:Flp pilus assembly protein CpaB